MTNNTRKSYLTVSAKIRFNCRWLWLTTIARQTLNATYSSVVAHQYTALLTLSDRNMSLIEADTSYQGCLPSCKLHSRSLAVKHTGKVCRLHMQIMRSGDCGHVLHNLKIAHTDCTHVIQFPDCAHMLHNLESDLEIACSISGFWECATQSWDCTNSQIARNIYVSAGTWWYNVLYMLISCRHCSWLIVSRCGYLYNLITCNSPVQFTPKRPSGQFVHLPFTHLPFIHGGSQIITGERDEEAIVWVSECTTVNNWRGRVATLIHCTNNYNKVEHTSPTSQATPYIRHQ